MMNTISAFSSLFSWWRMKKEERRKKKKKYTQNSDILIDNKEKRDNRCWTHKKLGKSYVGSAISLSSRSKNYFNEYYLDTKRRKWKNNITFTYLNWNITL